jgi:hypothetical protein
LFCLLFVLLTRMEKKMETRISSLDDKLAKLAGLLEQAESKAQSAVTVQMAPHERAPLCARCRNRVESVTPASSESAVPRRGFFEATEASESNAMQTLLLNCSDINAMDSIGFTPLHSAVYKGNYEAAETLISKGADVNMKDGFGRTPLHWAAYKGQPEMVKLLLQKVDDINVKHNIGYTPLHVAAVYGNMDAVRVLLDSGADIRATDNDGRTPLDAALEHDRQDIAALLRSRGA